MNTSDSISKISQALLKAQKAITFAVKDSVNPHLKSRYADLPTVIDAIKPALNESGIVFVQAPEPAQPGFLALTTRLLHESGEWIESTAVMPLPKQDPQGYGSAITYLRRYSLAAAVGLYQDDDDGNEAGKRLVHKPTDGIMETLGEETQAHIRATAIKVTKACQDGMVADAIKHLQAQGFDNDEKVALWSLLDSKVRAAIKKAESDDTSHQ